MKCKRKAFTIVEVLTVLAIMAILVGVLMPSLSFVRNVARNTKQKAQFVTIDQALITFRNDYGDYPPSGFPPPNVRVDYSGAQMLAEALLGRDLLGFYLGTAWDAAGSAYIAPAAYNALGQPTNRLGPYLETGTANAFRLGVSAPSMRDGLWDVPGLLAPNTFVICDAFGVKPVIVGQQTVKAGTPILYYRANPSSKTITIGFPPDRIYNVFDNDPLVQLGSLTTSGQPRVHPLGNAAGTYQFYYEVYIRNPKVAQPWPYRADSYILISAGVDGLYGTSDDITNFGY